MAYATGTYASRDELIGALKAFAESNGWTTDFFGDFRGGKRLSHHDADGLYAHWYSANNIYVNAFQRDVNGSYTGPATNTIVLHFGTGYDATRDPAWQPGVAGSVDSYSWDGWSSRAILTAGYNIPNGGVYHFVAAPGLLAMMLDIYGATFRLRPFVIGRVTALPGGTVSRVASGYGGPAGNYDGENLFNFETSQFSKFYPDNRCWLYDGAWKRDWANAEGCYQSFGMGSVGYSGLDESIYMLHSQPSGSSGVHPLYPVLITRRNSNLYRPVGVIENVARLNATPYRIGDPLVTTSGTWRVFRFSSIPHLSFALRADL